MRICFTKVSLPYGWLGNMAPYPVEWNGESYRTSEALFQAMRFVDPQHRLLIASEKSPMGAKFKAKNLRSLGYSSLLSSDQDLTNMRIVVGLKIEQHPELISMLDETGDAILTEDVTSRMHKGNNMFWGAGLENGQWIGENWLGKIWMEYRK